MLSVVDGRQTTCWLRRRWPEAFHVCLHSAALPFLLPPGPMGCGKSINRFPQLMQHESRRNFSRLNDSGRGKPKRRRQDMRGAACRWGLFPFFFFSFLATEARDKGVIAHAEECWSQRPRLTAVRPSGLAPRRAGDNLGLSARQAREAVRVSTTDAVINVRLLT